MAPFAGVEDPDVIMVGEIRDQETDQVSSRSLLLLSSQSMRVSAISGVMGS